MLKIRLSRTGKKHEPHYRIVVTQNRSKRDGEIIEQVGHWHPKQNFLKMDNNLYNKWLAKGARPSSAVRNLNNEKTA